MDIKERREPKINLSLGCSLAAMREMKDNQYDLAIVDPPYGIKEAAGKNHSRVKLAKPTQYKIKDWDSNPPNGEYFEELFRVSKDQIIWGANHFANSFNSSSSSWIVWNKVNYGSHFADCELAYTSHKRAVRMFSYQWNGMLQGDMKNKEKRIHPTQKPIALYKWLLENYAKEGDKILDTHLGSGSIACACYDLGFDLDAFEIDTDYYKDTLLRYTEYSKQCKLF